MSFWSAVYAGHGPQIASAIRTGARGDSVAVASVDLPGIMPSEELASSPDTLTQIASKLVGEPMTFAASIADRLAGSDDVMEATDGVYVMAKPWVHLFARLSEAQADEVATKWAHAIDPEGDASAFVAMVRGLADTCRVAQARGAHLVYSWSM